MTNTGTFIINGAERVIVSQLVRSPSVYFSTKVDKNAKKRIPLQLFLTAALGWNWRWTRRMLFTSGSTVHVKYRLRFSCVHLVLAQMLRFWICSVMTNISATHWTKTTRIPRRKHSLRSMSVFVRASRQRWIMQKLARSTFL